MTDTIIQVENLSKRYFIGHQRDAYDALRHRIEGALRHPLNWTREMIRRRRATQEEFWALKNVSFEAKQGEAIGIIGRNGAGKTTLLKILSQITEPTKGRIRLGGRVASLLEVGTGFHQDLTGRENIFLNGAILGMTRQEIKRKFDEIVAFSEVEKFLDTPVKRYSTGMYVRLAFAVAAHLEPEILIMDEVLAVGDAAFQKKCLGKMGEVAHGGRTVLFVSHNMSAVQALCRKAIYLDHGVVKAVGDVEPLVNRYLVEVGSAQSRRFTTAIDLGPSLKLESLDFPAEPVKSGEMLPFGFTIRAEKSTTLHDLSILIYSSSNMRVAILDLRSLGTPIALSAGRVLHAVGEIKSLPLVEGEYSVGLYMNSTDFQENFFDLASFTVSARTSDTDYVPVPLMYRGLVELDFTAHFAKATTESPNAIVTSG
jgi:ABC-type polysaccharide/polyol phosphate transport system ATPase subunit